MNKIASVKTINGKATVTVDTEQSHEVIDVENGACLVLVKGEDSDDPQPEPEPEPTPDPFHNRLRLGDLIAKMNGELTANGFKAITDLGTPTLYEYLLKAWDKADAEWSNPDSWMFSPKTYEDIINLHGDELTYMDTAYNSMHAWLMAMQLAALVPTQGIDSNMQTRLFVLAYEVGGGRAVPLYGLHIHANPMLARLVAGLICALVRNKYSYAEMDVMRQEIGGTLINGSKWSDLGYEGADGKMQKCGYLVNSDIIIPSAPGPYADGCDIRVKPFQQGQDMEQFCIDGAIEPWYKENYKKDIAVDDYVVANFNMSAQTPLDVWNATSEADKQRILEAAAAPRATDNFFFGKKLIKFDGIHDGNRLGLYTNYTYYWFSEASAKGAGVYEIAGPFADLYDKMFTGGGYGTPTNALKFFDTVMAIADNSRYPTFHNQYGRRRPCGGASGTGGSARSNVCGDPLNAIYNIDLSCIFADDKASADKWAKENGFVSEKPKSYPSGHAAMVTTVALMLGQMTGDETKLQQYFKAAYQVGVNRTVSRYHWNSDVIYGRLFATMIMPVIDAMSGLRDGYEQTKAAVNGTTPSPTPDYTKDVNTTVTIKNESGKTVHFDGSVCFVTYGSDPRGGYTGYFRVKGNCSGDYFTIEPGESKTYNTVFAHDDRQSPAVALNMPFASASQRGKYKSNNCYYQLGEGMTCKDFPTTDTFREGGTYTMVIPADTHEWTL